MKKETVKIEKTTPVEVAEVIVGNKDVKRSGNIYARIAKVANAIGTIEKSLVVGVGVNAYKALADIDVVQKVKEQEEIYGVVSVPVGVEIVKSEIVKILNQSGNEDVQFHDVIKVTWDFVNVDKPSDKITVESVGRGLDYGDKGLNKAMTLARKYALLNAYKIAGSTEDDPDAKKSDRKMAVKVDEMKIELLNFLADKPQRYQDICKHFGVDKVKALDDKQVKTVYNSMFKKGEL